MATPIALSEEQLTRLVSAIGVKESHGTFSRCTARFDGERNTSKLEDFIATITVYKEAENVSDKNALIGFPLLLEGFASNWWQGVKSEARVFNDAIKLLRSSFAPPKPAWRIYVELFEDKQKHNESTDEFICKKRSLFSQLTDEISEEIMINMIYGQILLNIRDKVPRNSVKTFQDLLKEAREAEILNKEARPQRKPDEDFKKKRCTFCRKQGHLVEQCFKKANNQTENKKTTLNCYGCGAAGYCRTNCPTCSNKNANSPTMLDFNLIESTIIGRNVPTVDININGLKGEAYIDTAARTSVAGARLYQQLIKKGCTFQKVNAEVTLADGIPKKETVYSTVVDIIIGKRLRKIRFIALPRAKDNRTLLGIDFLEQCGLVLNIAQRAYHFVDDPETRFDFKLAKCIATKHVKQKPNYHKALMGDDKLKEVSAYLTWVESHESLSPIGNTPKRKRDNDYSPHAIQAIFSDAIPQNIRTPEKLQEDLFSEPTRKKSNVDDWFVFNSIDIKLRSEEGCAICSHEKLQQVKEGIPFTLKTDASSYAIGTVLLQGRMRWNILWSMQVAYSYLLNATTRQPKRDGPYIIFAKKGSSSFTIAKEDDPSVPLEKETCEDQS